MAVDFDGIRRDYPLATVVGRALTTPLKKAGGNKVTVCPFHADRGPSLVLYPDHFHCFGCAAHGDVIDFVAKLQHLSTGEAIRYLTGGEAPILDDADRQRRDAERKHAAALQEKREQDATLAARTRWQRALPINGVGNGYLERKGVAPYGTRREGDNLIVPIFDGDGLIQSVQSIQPQAGGEKMFHGGAPVKGGTFTIGKTDEGPIAIVEGFATGATVQAASGLMVVIGFSKGALKTTAQLAAKRFPGRTIIVCADTNGVAAAEAAAKAVGGRVIVPDLQGAEGSDFNDQAAHYGLEDVAALFAPPPVPMLGGKPLLSPADWQGHRPPPRIWIVDGFVPDRQATLLTGAGATGKSLASQLKSTCIALGMPFLGLETLQRKALYLTCEDDEDELHRRQEAICAGLGVPLSATRDRLYLQSLYGEPGNELCVFDADRMIRPSPRYAEIVATAQQIGVSFVVLDNTSHMFTGNENARSEVAAFTNLCNRMAREISGAVVMVGFPNKAGDSYSGSTAWENQVRSRLYLETPKNEDGAVLDADYRVLRNEKANYARKGAEIGFRWSNGTFVLPDEGTDETPVSHTFTDAHAYEALREIDRRWRVKNPFSAAFNSPERYLGTWLQMRFKLSGRAASAQIKAWGAAELIASEVYDTTSKKQGLRVVNWPDAPCGSVRK